MSGYDIHFQPVPSSQVRGYKTFTFGFKAALKVKGPQSLVNRWVKTVMTLKGSDPLDPSYGTALPNLMGANVSNVTTEVKDVLVLAMDDASAQVRQQDIAGLYSDDERLQSAILYDFTPSEDGFQVWVEIRNMAGQILTVHLMDLATR